MFQQKPALGTPLNSAHPLASVLVGCWLMNEGGGNKINDLSGNRSNGAASGTLWLPGSKGAALQFDGADDHVDCGTNKALFSGGDEITVVTSLKQKLGSTIAQYDTVLCRCESGGYGYRLWTRDGSNFKYYWEVRDGAADDTWINSTSEISSTNYQQVAATCKGNSFLKLYIDGVEEASDLTLDHTWSDYSPFRMGAMPDGPRRFFPMDLEYIYVFSRVLTNFEIAQLYREPFAMFAYELIELLAVAAQAAAGVTIPVMIHHYKQAGGL